MEAFSGWMLFGRDGTKRGFFRQAGNILSAHADEGFAAEKMFSIARAKVVRNRSGQIVVDMRDGRRLRFVGDTEEETKVWFRKLVQSSTRTFHDNYSLEDPLKGRQQGELQAAVCKITRVRVAVKTVPYKLEQIRDGAEREVKVAMSIVHPSVNRTYEVFDDGETFCLVMERLDGGNLAEYVKAHGGLGERLTSRISWDVLLALRHLHDLRIIHRDISPESILLVDSDPENTRPGETVAKICDFGYCSIHRPPRKSDKATDSTLACDTFVNKYYILAPEQARNEVYGSAVDVWACGVTMYFMLMGDYPFSLGGDDRFLDLLRSRRDARVSYGYEWDRVSPSCRRLVERMLQPTAFKRPSAATTLRSSWFAQLFEWKLQTPKPAQKLDGVWQLAPDPPSLDGLVKDTNKVAEPLRLVTQSLRRTDSGRPLRAVVKREMSAREIRRETRTSFKSSDFESRSNKAGSHASRNSDFEKGSGSFQLNKHSQENKSQPQDGSTSVRSLWHKLANLSGDLPSIGKDYDSDAMSVESDAATPWEEFFVKYDEEDTRAPVEFCVPCKERRSIATVRQSLKRSLEWFPARGEAPRIDEGRSRRGVDEPSQRWAKKREPSMRSTSQASKFWSMVSDK